MNDIQKFHTSRENQSRQINKLPELKDQFEAIEMDEGALDVLLAEDHIVSFIQTLESLAQETHTEIAITSKESGTIVEQKKAVTPPKQVTTAEGGTDNKKKDESIMGNLPFDRYLHLNIALTGEYADIVAFLYKMEALPFALDVVSLGVRLKDGEGTSQSMITGSGVNPFMLTPGGKSARVSDSGSETAIPKGQVEAVFDTLVYIAR